MSKKNISFLLLIFLAGALLRFYRLGDVPVGLHRDEAFLGYNAYSLLKTGNDMTGKFLPLHFESFIYSPGGYSYFAIPGIFFYGLTAYAVRFPAAFFGSLTILLTFFLATKIIGSRSIFISLGSAFLLAITPWHINLSRASAESILVVFFISLGTLLFLMWNKTFKKSLLLLSFISFSVTLTLYQAPRAFLPLFLPVLILSTIPWSQKKKLIVSSVLYVIFVILPVIGILSSPLLATRMKTVGIWSTDETKLTVAEQIREDGVMSIPSSLSRLMHNKFIGYTEVFLKNYFQHLSYNFLFTDQGLPDRYRVPDSGLLYIFMLPLTIIGFIYLYTRSPKQFIILSAWIFLAIVGSALTFDDIPNLQRTVLVFPALSVVTAVGWEQLVFQKNKKTRVILYSVLTCLLLFEGYRYLHHYYVQQIVHRPWYRQEGYQELVAEVEKRKSNYSHVVITNRESAPAIFFLFYTHYDPKKFQEETKSSLMRDFDRINFNTYTFSLEECPLQEKSILDPKTNLTKITCTAESNTLYVNSGLCPQKNICGTITHTVKRNDNSSVFQLLDVSDFAATSSAIQ